MQGGQPAIEIQPANPEIVYVPYYNPEYIWGRPRYGYYPAWDYPGFGIGFGFGRGIYIGAFFGGLGWGGWGWGPNWFHCSIIQNRFFFDRYGFGGRGFRASTTWAHDPGHRLGVRYPNSTLIHRYGGVSTARGEFSAGRFGRQSYAVQQHNSAYRANPAQAGGWNHFGQAGSTNQGEQRSLRSSPTYNGSGANHPNPSYSGSYGGGNRTMPGYRNPSDGNSNGYRPNPSIGGSYGGNRTTPSYRSSPPNANSNGYRPSPSTGGSYGGSRTTPSYRSSPSNSNSSAYRASPSNGGSYGGNRTVPSYHSSPSYGGGGYQSSRSYGGGGSNRSGAGSHGGGAGSFKAVGAAPRMVQGIKRG
jgi:hypothetical protein